MKKQLNIPFDVQHGIEKIKSQIISDTILSVIPFSGSYTAETIMIKCSDKDNNINFYKIRLRLLLTLFKMIIFVKRERYKGHVYAIALRCPHCNKLIDIRSENDNEQKPNT
jgi:hypothetical protein